MVISETEIKQQGEVPDTYRFWGIVQHTGEVCPINREECIYYTSNAVVGAPQLQGTELNLDHFQQAPAVGEVLDEALLDDILFGYYEMTREMFNEFAEFVEQENGNIDLTYNQLVREIDDGNLALSAGLGVRTAATPFHDFTVIEITKWDEVSVVGAPASPGSWAWSCGDSCSVVFGEQTMSQETKTLDVDIEAIQQAAEEGHAPDKLTELIQSDDWGDEIHGLQFTPDGSVTVIDDEEELTQSSCDCGDEKAELRQKIEELKQERDNYQEVVQSIEEERREDTLERIREVNQKLPEDEQYSDEEITELGENSKLEGLKQTADMLERLASNTKSSVEQGKEDLSGTSGGSSQQEEEVEEARERVDDVVQEMFGKDIDTVFDEIEQGEWGN